MFTVYQMTFQNNETKMDSRSYYEESDAAIVAEIEMKNALRAEGSRRLRLPDDTNMIYIIVDEDNPTYFSAIYVHNSAICGLSRLNAVQLAHEQLDKVENESRRFVKWF